MGVLNLIFFASLVSSSWCGLIVNNLYDNIRSKLYDPAGLHQESTQNSPMINIISQEVVNKHMLNGPRGDYGSLPLAHGVRSSLQSNFKAVGISTPAQNGMGLTSYSSKNHMDGIAGSFNEDIGNDMSSHQIMKQESFKRDDGHKFGYHHDNNMFGNVQGLSGFSISPSSISSAGSSLYDKISASNSSNASTSGVNAGLGLKPWNHRF